MGDMGVGAVTLSVTGSLSEAVVVPPVAASGPITPPTELEDAGEVGADDLVHASASATSAARLATVILGADIHRSSEKP